MLMGAPNWMFQTDLPDDIISNSLRFEDGSTHYLSKTPSGAGNRRTFTISLWFKRGNLGSFQELISAYDDSSEDNSSWFGIALNSTDIIRVDGWNAQWLQTSQVVRDTTNWYHLVVAVNSTDSTADDRIKVYLNGSQITSFGTRNNPAEDHDFGWNNTIEQRIGAVKYSTNAYPFDGYIADVNCIDGSALTPTSFGREVGGVWIPKDTSGLTFGTNGFRLQFKQTGTGTASASTIGADTSGNTNHFTSNNLASSDVVPDTPENNFATMNPLQNIGITHSEGNLDVNVSSGFKTARSTFYVSSGRWYWEVRATDAGNGFIGVSSEDEAVVSRGGEDSGSAVMSSVDGDIRTGGDESTSYGNSVTDGDVLGVALDMVDGKLYISENGVFHNSGDPVNGTNPAVSNLTKAVSPSVGLYDNEDYRFNFGQDDTFAGALSSNGVTGGGGKFRYAPPAGYKALCSRNLNEPAFSANPTRPENADDNFNTLLWSGNGSYPRALTGVGFQPDWVWMKARNQAYGYGIFDSSRGASSGALTSHHTNAEPYANTNFDLDSFDADGMTWASTADTSTSNNSGDTYVGWNWKCNGGTTTTNDASVTGIGTIDSTYQANPDAGFSIVTWTGTGSAGTLAHGLGTVPKMIIIKNRESTQNWVVYHASNTSAPATDNVYLNLNNATDDEASMFNDTAPTSTVFSIGTNANVNNNTEGHVAYLFSEVEGYSKFGSYVGNASADGTFTYTGFKPAFILGKSSGSTQNWFMFDNKRDVDNVVGSYLQADLNSAEGSGTYFDFLSNGFKARDTTTWINGSSTTYIYMAFAEQPFKYSNAA